MQTLEVWTKNTTDLVTADCHCHTGASSRPNNIPTTPVVCTIKVLRSQVTIVMTVSNVIKLFTVVSYEILQ